MLIAFNVIFLYHGLERMRLIDKASDQVNRMALEPAVINGIQSRRVFACFQKGS